MLKALNNVFDYFREQTLKVINKHNNVAKITDGEFKSCRLYALFS